MLIGKMAAARRGIVQGAPVVDAHPGLVGLEIGALRKCTSLVATTGTSAAAPDHGGVQIVLFP